MRPEARDSHWKVTRGNQVLGFIYESDLCLTKPNESLNTLTLYQAIVFIDQQQNELIDFIETHLVHEKIAAIKPRLIAGNPGFNIYFDDGSVASAKWVK